MYSSMGIFFLLRLSRASEGGGESAVRLRGRSEIRTAFLLEMGNPKIAESECLCLSSAKILRKEGRRVSSRLRILRKPRGHAIGVETREWLKKGAGLSSSVSAHILERLIFQKGPWVFRLLLRNRLISFLLCYLFSPLFQALGCNSFGILELLSEKVIDYCCCNIDYCCC